MADDQPVDAGAVDLSPHLGEMPRIVADAPPVTAPFTYVDLQAELERFRAVMPPKWIVMPAGDSADWPPAAGDQVRVLEYVNGAYHEVEGGCRVSG